MGLFDFFKKKPEADQQPTAAPTNSVDPNVYLLERLKVRITDIGYRAAKHPQYQSLIVNDKVEIATVIIDNPNNHPLLMHLMILTIHADYFPNGIEEHVAGLGETLAQKVDSVIDNYIDSTFSTIMESLSDKHYNDLDFTVTTANGNTVWHTYLGTPILQGNWTTRPSYEAMYDLVKDQVQDKVRDSPFNWLKLYISKNDEGNIIGECAWNNEPWPEGLAALHQYAQTWGVQGAFYAMKQFVVIKKCAADAS